MSREFFNTGKYIGEDDGNGGVAVFSPDKRHRLLTIKSGSKEYSMVDRLLREGYDDWLIDAEIDDYVKKLDADVEVPEMPKNGGGQLII